MVKLTQTPGIGEHKLFFCGDIIKFKLELDTPVKGRAFLRTNLEKGYVLRREVIARTLENRVGSAQDWHDIPMFKVNEKVYTVDIALTEVGHYEAMCCFFAETKNEPYWPGSKNIAINVEPAEYSCANSIYCAFPRQFGPNKYNSESKPIAGLTNSKMIKFDKEGFTVIPPSGTFRDLKKELDHIINDLNCRIIHLLPVNPTPTVYARMGRYGSPYASLDFTNIDPSLAEFDKRATPLEQFLELVDEIHHKNAKLIIDVAINHTGWASKVHEEHPEWLLREEDGKIISPGAWGVTWGDLTELDHKNLELREYLAEMFLIWCERGVDGFRCDAGYMIPFDVWEYIIANVKQQYPDTIFLLEGLGGDIKITLNLLDKANMNWAYSELFQNYTKKEITEYVEFAHKISGEDGLMVNYAETHDNNRLAATSKEYSMMRTGLCALLSSSGAFGFTNGVEWFATEKIDVHQARALNWGSETNQVDYLSKINTILINHPAFHRCSKIKFVDTKNDNIIGAVRTCKNNEFKALILINLDYKNPSKFKYSDLDLGDFSDIPFYDLLNDLDLTKEYKEDIAVKLKPGQILCLEQSPSTITNLMAEKVVRPDIIDVQRARALALEIICWKNSSNVVNEIDSSSAAEKLIADPLKFCSNLYTENTPVPIVHFSWPEDTRRKIMIPPNHMLFVTAPHRFRVSLKYNNEIVVQHYSLYCKQGKYFTFLKYSEKANLFGYATISIHVYTEKKCVKTDSDLLLLGYDFNSPNHYLSAKEIRKFSGTFLDTNGRGGMMRPCLNWGEINDGYNAVLAANTNTDYPVDRQIMFNRARAWILRQGRSEELNINTTRDFFINSEGGGTWTFHVPVGNGLYADCSIAMIMVDNCNALKMSIYRHPSHGKKHYMQDDDIIHFIMRPDIEDRSFHEETKANDELKQKFEKAVSGFEKGFSFSPTSERTLRVISSKGFFGVEPEWKTSISRKTEAERGFEEFSDLYSPGYYKIDLAGGEHAEILAQVLTDKEKAEIEPMDYVDYKYLFKPSHNNLEKVLLRAMNKFIVKRDHLKTVIAGYPWFLDWGRDTLICARGLIAAGNLEEVKKILLQFAKFSKNGTLPNIIHGDTVGNRDTSDAPLWLIIATEDYCSAVDNYDILNEKLDKERTMLESLTSIIENYIKGTSNGIVLDKESKLVYSPSHFTWMDTNYPAGTPREGYPVEIQALWYASLEFIGKISGNATYTKLSRKVKNSIYKFFRYEEHDKNGKPTGNIWLSDCLHTSKSGSAEKAKADDHIRPNQLWAITLGAVDNIELSKSIIQTCSKLLVPGAIRSIADRENSYKLPVYNNDKTKLLNNPENPYFSKYEGNEDTSRKPAYHNGTAWTFQFPLYSEAYYKVFGVLGKEHALSILSSSEILFRQGSFYQIPEIVDGDLPHRERGCDAQAWGVTELYRVWKMLK
ncbi:MAG: glycogen debranching enzyme N-terminal domain-containing protein [Victivallales bacterium]|nr:glycogen debranching enzyme N-terminal domain-containing protein [Victivallales bacterium]MCF7888560.1 glycogen debranching enzyme N-terminal domain-containing protein [Victivallales bacterium]